MAALEEQELEWGSQKRIQREQEDRNTGSWVQKIKGPVASKKREQEDNKGARSKRRKYAVEQEDWGEPSSQEQISECSTIEYTTFWELPPKEQRTGGRRSKQKSIADYLKTSEEVTLGPAGTGISTENCSDALTEETAFETLHELRRKDGMVNTAAVRMIRNSSDDQECNEPSPLGSNNSESH